MARETESLDSGFRVVERYLSGWMAFTGDGDIDVRFYESLHLTNSTIRLLLFLSLPVL
jgi:hypothetical protein